MTEVRRLLIVIGAAEGDASRAKECALTELGRAAVLCALRANALRPAAPPVVPPEPPPVAAPRAERAAVVLPPVPGGAPPHLDPMNTDDRAELISLARTPSWPPRSTRARRSWSSAARPSTRACIS